MQTFTNANLLLIDKHPISLYSIFVSQNNLILIEEKE